MLMKQAYITKAYIMLASQIFKMEKLLPIQMLEQEFKFRFVNTRLKRVFDYLLDI